MNMDTPTNGPTSGSATNGAPLNFIRDGDVVTLVDAKGGAAAYILHIGVRTNASDVRRLALEAQPDPRPHSVETCPCEICTASRSGTLERWVKRMSPVPDRAVEALAFASLHIANVEGVLRKLVAAWGPETNNTSEQTAALDAARELLR